MMDRTAFALIAACAALVAFTAPTIIAKWCVWAGAQLEALTGLIR